MASPSNAVKTQTSIITIRIAGVDVLTTDGRSSVLPGSSFITPVALAIASTPESASTIPTKPAQFCAESSVQRLQMTERLAEMRQAEKPKNNHDDRGRDRNKKREAAGLFRSEQIEQSDDKNRSRSEFFRMRHAEILKGRKRADRSGHQVIGDEQKRADDGDHLAAMPNTRVNATAVWIKTADNHVVDPDERSEYAHRGDEPERCIAGDSERQPYDVGLAGAPVPVKNRSRARAHRHCAVA